MDLRGLSDSVNRIASTVEKRGPAVLRATALIILQAVVMGTPVGNVTLWNDQSRRRAPEGYVGGRARANWFVAVGGPATAVTEDVDPSGGNALSSGQTVIGGAGANEEIHITNNLPYIMPLNEGHSAQAPAGFVETAVMAGNEYAKTQKYTTE